MNNHLMIEKLKTTGIIFADGLTDEEIVRIESAFGFRFPREIREFLSCAVPVGDDFFDWRDMSETNLEKLRTFQKQMEDAFVFDVENSEDLLREFLGETVADIAEKETLRVFVMDWLRRSVKLIPFYAHRCFFDGMDDMPIVSFWQAVDAIFFGSDFENYLENEFLHPPEEYQLGEISDRMKETGIWYRLIG